MRTILPFITLLASAVALSDDTSLIFARSINCAPTDAVCGNTCIPNTYTCCPDLAGGCSATETCQMGSNGVYGCCPTGNVCQGDGGAEYLNGTAASGTPTAASSQSTSTSNAGVQGTKAQAGLAALLAVGGLAAVL